MATPVPLSSGAARVQAMREADALIARLHAHFRIAHPVRVTWSGIRGRAYGLRSGGGTYRINMTDASPMGPLPLAVHEFAHILDFHRHHGSQHNQRYYRLLLEVMQVAGIAPRDYPWAREYATLNAFAQQDGFTRQPTAKQARAKAASLVGAKNGVRPGVLVSWSSPKHGTKTGRVVSAYSGCRAKVKLADGTIWFVPQDWLNVIAPDLLTAAERL